MDGPGTDMKFDGFGNVLVKLGRELIDVCFIRTYHKSYATQGIVLENSSHCYIVIP